jgi:uncharacterized protein (DUF433 family)
MYTGTGIYTLPQAERLTHVSAKKIRRWLYGYSYPTKSSDGHSRRFSAPLWTPQHGRDEYEADVIGFHDLLEIRFVSAFAQHGVPLSVIRKCVETAKNVYRIDYPLSSCEFKTDGRTIFAQALKESSKEDALLDLKSRQFAFRDIISPSLYAGIEYDGHLARKWFPLGKRHDVVLDPARQFGAPILNETGTPTDVLYASYLAEGATPEAIKQTAQAYEVHAKLVNDAIVFEESLKRSLH